MKQHKRKKVYTKSDYIYMYSKLTVITGIFATVGMSLALFLGFVVTLIGHDRLGISSQLSLVLFILSLPVVIRKLKHYKAIQDRLQGKCPDDTKETIASQVVLPNRKAIWTGIILLAFLGLVILSGCFLMLWCMVSFYDNVFLIMFIFLGALSLPVFAVMLVYIRLLPAAKK